MKPGARAQYVWKFNLKGAGTGTAGTPAVQNPTGGGTTADQIDASSLALPTGLVTINITGFNGSSGTAFNPNLNYAWTVADVKSAANLTGLNPQLFVLNTSNAGFTTSASAFSISGAPDGAGGEDLIISYTGAGARQLNPAGRIGPAAAFAVPANHETQMMNQ